MTEAEHLNACLERWRARAQKRRAYALQVMAGKRTLPADWPQWMRYDIEAEIALIHDEREQDRKTAERIRIEREAKERRKEDLYT